MAFLFQDKDSPEKFDLPATDDINRYADCRFATEGFGD